MWIKSDVLRLLHITWHQCRMSYINHLSGWLHLSSRDVHKQIMINSSIVTCWESYTNENLPLWQLGNIQVVSISRVNKWAQVTRYDLCLTQYMTSQLQSSVAEYFWSRHKRTLPFPVHPRYRTKNKLWSSFLIQFSHHHCEHWWCCK